MIIVLKHNVTQEAINNLTTWLEAMNVKVNPVHGSETTILGVIGDTSSLNIESIEMQDYVERVMKVQEPFKKANRKFHPDNTVIKVGSTEIGGEKLCIIAGPCSVEGEQQIVDLAASIKEIGGQMLRGGAFKPRSSPYAFQGLKSEGLILLKHAKDATNLPIVSEITNPYYLELFLEYVDVIQVGARNMQNFELLKALGRTNKPILLKRGFSNTIEELLMACEYIMSGGNDDVILCERGIRTFETYTRNTLDISAIPALKRMSHLPVLVDPSHASGMSWMVDSLSRAAIAAGADGLIIEVHNDPKNALSDGPQSLTVDGFSTLINNLKPIATAMGRSI